MGVQQVEQQIDLGLISANLVLTNVTRRGPHFCFSQFTFSSIRLIDGSVAGSLDVCMPCIGVFHLVLVCSVGRAKKTLIDPIR